MHRTMEFISAVCLQGMFNARPPHGPHDSLMGMATSTALLLAAGGSRRAALLELAKNNVLRSAQFDAYVAGRTCPSESVAKRLNQVFAGTGEPALWPRVLLSLLPMRTSTLSRISRKYRDESLPNVTAQSATYRKGIWSMQLAFSNVPREQIWRTLYRLRYAELFGMQEMFWEEYWDLLRMVPEFAAHPALYPHRELFFHLISRLFGRCPGHPAPIYVDWDAIRQACEQRRNGLTAGGTPFIFGEVSLPPHGSVFAADAVMPSAVHDGYRDEWLL